MFLHIQGILVSGNGWANPATIDIIYDVLHMMGRDDILVGLGNITALGAPELGCEYVKAVPHGPFYGNKPDILNPTFFFNCTNFYRN